MKNGWGWMWAVALLVVATPGEAQTPDSDASKEAARILAETGKTRFEAGDYKGAIEALRDAEKYYRAPTIARLRGEAHEKLGQLLEARAIYTEILASPLAADAPDAFKTAHEAATAQLASLEKRIPKVTVALAHAPLGTRATVDGSPVDTAALTRPLRLNPGKHVIAALPARAGMTRTLDLKEGSVERVELDFAPPPAASASPAASAVAMTAASGGPNNSAGSANPPQPRSMVAPGIAFGIGGVGLIAGAITGGLTLAKAADIRALCGDDLECPKSSQEQVNLDQAKALSHVSTVGFALAGAGALTGVLLLVLPGSDKPSSGQSSLVVGPGFVGVRGAF
ncbi:MAG: hypothetical protein R3F14_01045 [Polyangiaceae bacterium]